MEQKNRNDTGLMYNWTNMLQRNAQQADQAQLPKNTSPAISQNSPHECELDRYPRFLLKYFLQIILLMDPWSVGNGCGWLSSDKRVGHSVRAAVVLDVQSVRR